VCSSTDKNEGEDAKNPKERKVATETWRKEKHKAGLKPDGAKECSPIPPRGTYELTQNNNSGRGAPQESNNLDEKKKICRRPTTRPKFQTPHEDIK